MGRLLLVSVLCSVVPHCLAQLCCLDSVPVEDVPLPELQNFQKVDGGRRRLRLSSTGGGDFTALSRYEEVAEGASGGTAAHAEGRRCACADWIHDKESYYCPLPADRCLVSRARHGAPTIKCYVHGGWEVRFARYVWLYLCILLLLMVCSCFYSPGRHAVRYIFSWCIPGMNGWIAKHLLRAEIEARRNLVSEELKRSAPSEGWILGYCIKTKLHSREGTSADDDGENVAFGDMDADPGGRTLETTAANGAGGGKANDWEDEDGMCTICLMAVEDGDRVPNLGCGHLFHADCLSRWILKKNSCPLCSGPVAQEIRSFETVSPAETTGNACAEDMVSRLRCYVRDSILDVATGRDRRAYAANRNRIRAMLNDRSTDALDGPM